MSFSNAFETSVLTWAFTTSSATRPTAWHLALFTSNPAEDASGNFIEAGTFSAGVVSAILFDEGETFAIVNGQKVSVNEISKVSL